MEHTQVLEFVLDNYNENPSRSNETAVLKVLVDCELWIGLELFGDTAGLQITNVQQVINMVDQYGIEISKISLGPSNYLPIFTDAEDMTVLGDSAIALQLTVPEIMELFAHYDTTFKSVIINPHKQAFIINPKRYFALNLA